MTKRVVLHVGTPKSGTTYLQQILVQNAPRLERAGVLVLGRRLAERVHVGFAIREDPRLADLSPQAQQTWATLVEQAKAWRGDTVVFSYELLAGATPEQAQRAVADLVGCEVHVVVTARDLGRAVTSAWQERLKFSMTKPLEKWRPKPEDALRSEWGWRTMDPAGVAQRWATAVPADRLHVVVAPRNPRLSTSLWELFAQSAGIDVPGLDLSAPAVNESLGAAEAELLRRVNHAVKAPISGNREHSRWMRDLLAHKILAGQGGDPIATPDELFAEASTRAEAAIATISASAYDVVGDLDDLRATRREGRLPSEVTNRELVDVATQAIFDLVLAVRDSRSGAASVDAEETGSGFLKGLALRAASRPVRRELEAANRRIDELEQRVRATRQLQVELAAVTDLVAELLLPPELQRPEELVEALKAYRKESL